MGNCRSNSRIGRKFRALRLKSSFGNAESELRASRPRARLFGLFWVCLLAGWLLGSAASLADGEAPDAAILHPANASSETFETENWPPLLDPAGVSLADRALIGRPPAGAWARGERLEYAFSYLGIPVGRGFIKVAELFQREGRRLAHIVAGAETNAFFSVLYPIRDRMEAWIDLDAMRTLESRTWMGHGPQRIYEALSYDWDAHWLRVLRHRRHSGRGREHLIDFGPFVYDALDLVYTLRGFPARPGARFEIPVYASKKIYSLRFDVDEVETTESPILGVVRAWRLRSRSFLDGVPKDEEGQGELWVTADARRLPLRLTGWFRGTETFRIVGLRIELVDYQAGISPPPAPRAAEAPLIPAPPPRPSVATDEGRPLWDPPAAVQEARRALGLAPFARRFRFAATPEASWPPPPLGPTTEVAPRALSP